MTLGRVFGSPRSQPDERGPAGSLLSQFVFVRGLEWFPGRAAEPQSA